MNGSLSSLSRGRAHLRRRLREEQAGQAHTSLPLYSRTVRTQAYAFLSASFGADAGS